LSGQQNGFSHIWPPGIETTADIDYQVHSLSAPQIINGFMAKPTK
jgi:hypothetical protein